MKASQNQYAETLLKTVSGVSGGMSAAAGRLTAQTILESWGVPAGELIQRDGSGLSRYDFVTPDALVTILTHVDRDARLREPFEASLPIAGRDGSLSNRMKGTPAEGNARAKTGSMTGVRALVGLRDDRRRRAAGVLDRRQQLRNAARRGHGGRRRDRRRPREVPPLTAEARETLPSLVPSFVPRLGSGRP